MKINFTSRLTFAFTLIAGLAAAQNPDTSKRMNDAGGTFQVQSTYRYTQMASLNRILGANGLPPVGHNDIWINLSMNHICHNWIIEDGLGFTPWTTGSSNGIKTKFNQYQAFFKLGYNVVKSSDFRAFPFAGVNVSAAVLNVDDNTHIKSTSDFSGELTNSSISKTYYQPNFGVELGGGFDYLIKLKDKTMDCFTIHRSIPIGIRVGYYINAARGDWRVNNNYKLQNGPDKNQSAFFVSLNIGLGYAMRK